MSPPDPTLAGPEGKATTHSDVPAAAPAATQATTPPSDVAAAAPAPDAAQATKHDLDVVPGDARIRVLT